jgi:hypothetical protein
MTGFLKVLSMKVSRVLLVLCSVLVLSACGSSNRPPSVVDVPSFRTYITQIRANVATADESSFEEGEKAQLTSVSGEILQVLGDVNSFEDLSDDQKDNLVVLNDELHVLVVGKDDVRASGRICTSEASTGTNIRKRTCRSRDRLTRDREAVRTLLRDRDEFLNRDLIQ